MTTVQPVFRKATSSQPNQNCVEVARGQQKVDVRDSKAIGAGGLSVSPHTFDLFLATLR